MHCMHAKIHGIQNLTDITGLHSCICVPTYVHMYVSKSVKICVDVYKKHGDMCMYGCMFLCVCVM